MLPAWCSDARLALWICLGLWLLRFGRLQVPLFLVIFHTLICLASLICSVTFYVHTTRTVFNRRAPLAFMPWWRHFMMTRPLEVLWRFLTVPLRVQPDLLILGEVRTGTTSLAAYLRALGCVGAFSPSGSGGVCFGARTETVDLGGDVAVVFIGPDQERPLVFDACASHLTAPAAPALPEVAWSRKAEVQEWYQEAEAEAMKVLDSGQGRVLSRCDDQEKGGENSEKLAAARILAKDVLDSFTAMREYLREVGRCLERVDPHLCNNVGLVARLVDWEESWEVGTRYVQQEKMLTAEPRLV
eukprot:g23412.t1